MSRLAMTVILAVTIIAACKRPEAPESAVRAAPLSPTDCGKWNDPNRANPAHCEGNFYIDGPYNIREDVLEKYYRYYTYDDEDFAVYDRSDSNPPVANNRFGTFDLWVPGINSLRVDSLSELLNFNRRLFKPLISGSTGDRKFIRELHYYLEDLNWDGQNLSRIRGDSQRLGIRLIPVVDRKGSPDEEYQEPDHPHEGGQGGQPRRRTSYWDYDSLVERIPGGATVKGSQELDRLLTKFGEMDEGSDIFAMIAYAHPEQHQGTLIDLLKQKYVKTELSLTHLGAYIGEGVTRNSPFMYHYQKWWDEKNQHYPVNVYTVEMDGVHASVLNYNMNAVLGILNEFGDGVAFPEDYKFDDFKNVNLKENLAFFRAWIDRKWRRPETRGKKIWTDAQINEMEPDDVIYYAWKLLVFGDDVSDDEFDAKVATLGQSKAEQARALRPMVKEKQLDAPFYIWLVEVDNYRTYCAEHITIVVNLGLNVPQNEQGYKEIWGEREGARLWRMALAEYEENWGECEMTESERDQFMASGQFPNKPGCTDGPAMQANDYFDPLWKLHGISQPTRVTQLGKSMAWPIQTTADLVANFIENYLNFTDENMKVAYTSTLLVGMAPEIMRRLKISMDDYVKLIIEPIALMMKHAFTVKSHPILDRLPEWEWAQRAGVRNHLNTVVRASFLANVKVVQKAVETIARQKGPHAERVAAPLVNADLNDSLAKPIFNFLLENEERDHVSEMIEAWNEGTTPKQAWARFRKDAKVYLQRARQQRGGTGLDANSPERKYVTYYSPPGVVHKVVSNMHESDKFVHIREVATVMQANELCHTGRRQTVFDMQVELPAGFKCTDDPTTVAADPP